MAEVIPQINIDGTKIKNTWTEKEYVTDEVYNALNKAVIDLKNNNNLLDSNSILFREEYNSSSKDLNNAIHQGAYSFTNSAVNAPSGVNGGNLLVTNTSKTNQGSSIITQIAFCHNGAVYARTKNTSENFTAWNKLAYITDNVASATKASQDGNGNTIATHYLSRNQTNQNDMNACTVEGIYRFSGNLSNAWTGTSWGTLLVFNNHFNGASGVSGTFLVQLAFPTDGRVWTRQRVNTGAWTGWVTLARTSDNVASATKATQDKNGRDITGYLYKSESIELNSNASVVISGTISAILNAFCTKFKQIQGTDTYIENPPTSIKSLNDNKVSTAGDTLGGTYARSGDHIRIKNVDRNTNTGAGLIVADNFVGLYDWSLNKDIIKAENGKGYAIVNTPATSDNSTRIANTAFVKSLFTASKATNGWWKDGNTGIIWQWGSYYTTGTKQYFTFPITFPNGLFVITEAHIVSVDNDFKTCSIINPDKNGFTINVTEKGYVANVIAIGY